MPDHFFRVPLTVKAKPHGEAALVPPDALANVEFSYIVVKEGGEEAIITLSATSEVTRALERSKDVTRLTPKQCEQARAGYPAPRIKKQYRLRSRASDQKADGPLGDFELDAGGKKIVDTFQTVRSGFYLIDVPIVGEESAMEPRTIGSHRGRGGRGQK